MQGNTKRKLLAGLAVSSAALIMASTAYACTVYRGRVTLTAVGATTNTTATAVGAPGVHGYCSGDGVQTVDMNAQNQFTLAVAPTTDCGGSKLPSGDYEVRWVNMTTSQTLNSSYLPWRYNCNVAASNVYKLGTISVDGAGNSTTKTFNNPSGGALGTATPANGASGAVNLCVAPANNNPTSDSAPELSLWVV